MRSAQAQNAMLLVLWNFLQLFIAVIAEMEWTNQVIFEFLTLYQNEPALWNSANAEHKNKQNTYDAWSRIKTELGDGIMTITEIKRKRDNLMSTYRRLRSKVKASKPTGTGTSDVYKPD